MKLILKGLLLGAIQIALVSSLAGKLLYDRATRPRVWVQTTPADPDLPIRGRYISLRLCVPARDFSQLKRDGAGAEVALEIQGGELVAVPNARGRVLRATMRLEEGSPVAYLWEPLLFFIPEHAVDPSHRPLGEELWVEVTVPRKGPPRPIRLGIKKQGVLAPLDLR
jgi:hypothetical protein